MQYYTYVMYTHLTIVYIYVLHASPIFHFSPFRHFLLFFPSFFIPGNGKNRPLLIDQIKIDNHHNCDLVVIKVPKSSRYGFLTESLIEWGHISSNAKNKSFIIFHEPQNNMGMPVASSFGPSGCTAQVRKLIFGFRLIY